VLQLQATNVLVAERVVQLDEGLLLLGGEVAALEVRAEVVDPPQPAALPAPEQTCPKHIQIRRLFLTKIGTQQALFDRAVPACLGRARQLAWPYL
jgi:hypothetical protein